MKKNKNKYIAVLSCCVLAAVFAVGLATTTDDSTKNNGLAEMQNAENIANEPFAQVNSNKNAPAKTEVVPSENKQAKEEKNVEENVEEKTDKKTVEKVEDSKTEDSNTEDKSSADANLQYGDEFEDVGSFDEELVFSVPVSGEVAMDYSMDKMVYDPTLEQYRTSDSICYKAEEGTVVGAAAQGTVESVFNDNKDGTSVTVFHGDGWRTTYSQLGEDVAVSQGDIVEKGQTLGYVGKPAMYSSAMGSHLEFKMTLNGESVDPKTALAQ